MFSQLSLLLFINLSLPFLIPQIAWEAHVGGLVAGLAIAAAWDRVPHAQRGSVTQRVIVAGAVAIAAFVVVLLV